MIYGYGRTIRPEEPVAPQVEALRRAGAADVFRDLATEAGPDRPGFSRLLAVVRAGDIVLVTNLDRIARTTLDLLRALDRLAAIGAGFRSLAEPWADTTAGQGGSVAAVISGLASFERQSVRTRTGEGRLRAAARGVKLGPKFKLASEQRQDVLARLEAGEPATALARVYNVAVSTITRLRDAEGTRLVASSHLGASSGVRLMDPDTARTVQSFMRRIGRTYEPVDAVLYGSRARGTHRPDSDADLAVILAGRPGDRAGIGVDMAGIAVDVFDETGVLVSPLPLWADEIERPDTFSNPSLIEAIRRDGLRL